MLENDSVIQSWQYGGIKDNRGFDPKPLKFWDLSILPVLRPFGTF